MTECMSVDVGNVVRIRGDRSFQMTASVKEKMATKAGVVKVFSPPQRKRKVSPVRSKLRTLGKGVSLLVPMMMTEGEDVPMVANRLRAMVSKEAKASGKFFRTRTADIRGNEVVFAVMRDM